MHYTPNRLNGHISIILHQLNSVSIHICFVNLHIKPLSAIHDNSRLLYIHIKHYELHIMYNFAFEKFLNENDFIIHIRLDICVKEQ